METERSVASLLKRQRTPEPGRRQRYQILSGNALKMIALITMIIDHIGGAILEMGILYNSGTVNISYKTTLFLQNLDGVLRSIGRISFPIYCFLIAEGFVHTHSAKKYALRLGIFALISEIPFDLAFFHTYFFRGHQNVFFTLFLGLLAMSCIKRFENRPFIMVLSVIVLAAAAQTFHTDYGASGVLAIVLLYLLRDDRLIQAISGAIYFFPWERPAAFAFLPVYLYNGKRGKWKMKYLFYVIYPLHLIILYLICRTWLGV